MGKKCALFALASGVVVGYVAAKYGESIKNTVKGHFEKKSVDALADEIKKTVDMKGRDFSEYLKNVKVKRESDVSSVDTEVDGVSVEDENKPKYIDISFAELRKKFEEEDRAKEVAQIIHGTAKEGKAVLLDAIRKFKEMDSEKSAEDIVEEIKADIEINGEDEDYVYACNPNHKPFVMSKEQFDKVNSEKLGSEVVISDEVKAVMGDIVDETSTTVKKGTSKKKTSTKKSDEKKSEDKE